MSDTPLTRAKYGVAVSWDRLGTTVDIDLQGIAVAENGSVIDAVYYNNLKGLKGGLTHSGDERTGEKEGLDEVIWVNFNKVATVKMFVFVVAAHSGGHLRDAANGKIMLMEESIHNVVSTQAMERSTVEVDVVGLMRRDGGTWRFSWVDEPAQAGSHFMDILEPTIGNIIRRIIPDAPRRLKVSFDMEKAKVLDLSESSGMGRVYACLGWDVNKGKEVDLDVSAVLFDRSGKDLGAVFFGNLEEFGLEHSGDNLTGEGDADDEIITVNLEDVPPNCTQICFVVNIYTKGTTFECVSNAYCRILDEQQDEMARYSLNTGKGTNALAISRLFRDAITGRWGFQALGMFIAGRTWKDSLPNLKAIVSKSPRAIQFERTGSQVSMLSDSAHVAEPAVVEAVVVAPAGEGDKASGSGSGCCTTM